MGVVFRRGPAKCVCSVLWNRKTDEFTIGQWLHGRIYERRSDLSSDGKHLIYFALNGRWNSETNGTWTAVSVAPWLKAIVLLGKGDCWNGGGLFTSEKTYWLNDGHGHRLIRDTVEVQRDKSYLPSAHYNNECLGVYYVRLQRDGWIMRVADSTSDCTVFEKFLPNGWILRKYAHAGCNSPPGQGCYWDEHELEHANAAAQIDGAKWEWAELDRDDLVWAEAGCLFRATIQPGGLGERKLLHDFNGMKFEALEAPY